MSIVFPIDFHAQGMRPCIVLGGIEEPVLIVSYAHAVERYGEDAMCLMQGLFENCRNGVWFVPHPDGVTL